MVEIPDSLRTLFSAALTEEGDTYTISVPANEIEQGTLRVGETYRIVVLDGDQQSTGGDTDVAESPSSVDDSDQPQPAPPVSVGEVREVDIDSVGDQGDGIAKVERGFVVIVPGAEPGDQPTVEIEQVQPNVAFATVINQEV